MIGKSESNGYLFNNLETMLEQSQPLLDLLNKYLRIALKEVNRPST